jgi:hypothetical protein
MERTFRQYTLPQILKTAYLEDAVLGPFGAALGVAWQGFARLFPVDAEVLNHRAYPGRKAAAGRPRGGESSGQPARSGAHS